MWGAARARAMDKAGRREQVLRTEQVQRTRAPLRARLWDLVRIQAQMLAGASSLTEALEEQEAREQEAREQREQREQEQRAWEQRAREQWAREQWPEEKWAEGLPRPLRPENQLVQWPEHQWVQWVSPSPWVSPWEQPRQLPLAWEQPRQLAWAWTWAAEIEEETHAKALDALGLGRAQMLAWLRMWTLGEQITQEQKPLLSTPWVKPRSVPQPNNTLPPDIWPRRQQGYWWLIQVITPIARLPPELLHQIFLIIIDNDNDSPSVLMRVCTDWYNIVTGIWGSLKLGTTTPKDAVIAKLERDQWILDVLVDTEIDRPHLTPSKDAYQAIFAAMQATSRWRSLVVETFPTQADLPEDLVNPGLQQRSDPVLSRLRTLIIKCPCEMSPLLNRLLHILGNTASGELTTVTIHSPIVISFLVPTYSFIFRSVIVLSLDAQGLSDPVDLLPHLHQLETLTASHLPLPVYHDDVDLPFVHTLRRLTLRSVSIQWMSGRTFHVLESCTILFPLHRHVLHTFRTTLPNCRHLSFEGYPLDILSGVSAHKLTNLSVKCASSHKPQGNRQLALFSNQVLQEGRLAPRILHISIEATNSAWTKALASMSNMEELVINNAQPSSLGVKALQSLVVLSGTTATPEEWNTPACPSLKRFGLRYRRWLRRSEHFDLIPVFMSIIRSREQSKCPLQSFRIWGSSDQEDPLELVGESQIKVELTTDENQSMVPVKISGIPIVQQRCDVAVWLTLDFSSFPTRNGQPWDAVRFSRARSVSTHREGLSFPNVISIDVVVLGATTHKEYTEECPYCGHMIEFRGTHRVKNGVARVHFVFRCCYPAHRDEEKYYRCVRSVVLVPILLLTSLEQPRGYLIRKAHQRSTTCTCSKAASLLLRHRSVTGK